jgi:hypothetical protein
MSSFALRVSGTVPVPVFPGKGRALFSPSRTACASKFPKIDQVR